MITLYARQEPTTDTMLVKRYAPNTKKKDTVFYRDRGCTDFYGRWPWHVSTRPISRKTVTLNCWKFKLEWVTL